MLDDYPRCENFGRENFGQILDGDQNFRDQIFRRPKFSPTKIFADQIFTADNFPNLNCTKYPLPKTGDKLLLNVGQFKDRIENYK